MHSTKTSRRWFIRSHGCQVPCDVADELEMEEDSGTWCYCEQPKVLKWFAVTEMVVALGGFIWMPPNGKVTLRQMVVPYLPWGKNSRRNVHDNFNSVLLLYTANDNINSLLLLYTCYYSIRTDADGWQYWSRDKCGRLAVLISGQMRMVGSTAL